MSRLSGALTQLYHVLLFIVIHGPCSTVGEIMPVYTQQRRNDRFLYATGLPALEEISVCFWLFGVSDDDDRRRDALFSIASQTLDNEFFVSLWGDNAALMVQQGTTKAFFPDENVTSLDARFLGWKHHCFTMASGLSFKWYSKSHEADQIMELWHSVEVIERTIPTNGSLVLLQDQDQHESGNQLGGFDLHQTFEGRVALFSMWDFELTYEEIRSVSCLTQGNLLNMDDLSIMGPAILAEADVPCKPVVRTKTHNGKWILLFEKMPGAKQENYLIARLTSVSSIHGCVLRCATNSECFSINYMKLDGVCELNSYNRMFLRPNTYDSYTHYYIV